MRAARLSQLMTAALAVVALPAPAMACADPATGGGGGARHAKPAVKAPAKAGKPVTKPKPVAPKVEECCMPAAAAVVKPKAPAGACCAEGTKAGAKAADCCAEMAKASAKPEAACCEMGAKPGAACCDAEAKARAAKPMAPKAEAACCEHPAADGSCCSADKPHGAPGQGREVRIERRWGGERDGLMGMHGGPMGHRGMMMTGDRLKGPEVRYMPAMTPGANQHIVLARNAQLQVKPWLSLGHQMNWALQLSNTNPAAGPWFTSYGGFLPRVGGQVGLIRADLGLLAGVGAMLRTGQVTGATGPVNDVLQARVMWVLEPRVELGWRGEHMGLGLVGAYNYNPNMADFGGPSVGLKMTWKRKGWM